MFENINLEILKNLDIKELDKLAKEIRQFMIEEISKTGGHLGASLGVVELTIALHYIFSSPQDAIIWDIGHQSYTHKILTERLKSFHTIRSYGGLSGFTNPLESQHDHFFAGHSSTSISLGIGLSSAKDLTNNSSYTISIIGDGAISAGMAFEAMNNVATANTKFITILNDNDMSISPPSGAISKYLPKLFMSHGYKSIKAISKKCLERLPDKIFDFAKNTHKSIKSIVSGNNLFEEFGYEYIGPIDGHNIKDIIDILNIIKKNATKPVLLHIITEKGKGYLPAENANDKFHGVKPFDIKTGKQLSNSKMSCSQFIANTLSSFAKEDKSITAITPAMCQGSALENFAKSFPKQFFDVGIAEQHAVTFAAGQAKFGLNPFCFIYSTFLQRAYDQLIHDVIIQQLPVKFIIDRAGLCSEDGVTHHGIFDIAFLRILPNIEICNAYSTNSMMSAMEYAKSSTKPLFIRIPKETVFESQTEYFPHKIACIQLSNITKNLVITSGRFTKIITELEKYQNWTVIDPFFIKPMPIEILDYINNHDIVHIIDENSIGGLSSIILEMCHNAQIDTKKITIKTIPEKLIHHGSNDDLFRECGLL